MKNITMSNIGGKHPRVFYLFILFLYLFFYFFFFFLLKRRKRETPLFRMEHNSIDNRKVPHETQDDNIVRSKNKKEGNNVLRV